MKKGYKVTDVNRAKKVGVAADSLAELIEKSSKKLGVNVERLETAGRGGGDDATACRVFVAADGTKVEDDDYLATLPAQTVLVLLKPKEEMISDTNFLYELIRSTNIEYIAAGQDARDFLSTNIKEKFRVLQRYIAGAGDDRTALSQLSEDPTWFQGLDPSERTKEASMTKRVKDRMRGYFYKTKAALQSSDLYVHSKSGLAKTLIDRFLADIRRALELNNYNGPYFNRKAPEADRMCSANGQFDCGGLWNLNKCAYESDHAINPYRSREERIIFQTWNLDHQIEISRSIIPKILMAVESVCKQACVCEECNKNVKEGFIGFHKYYLQIFTRNNLKLVHIVCHYKGKHQLESDIYVLCKKCYNLQPH